MCIRLKSFVFWQVEYLIFQVLFVFSWKLCGNDSVLIGI